MIVKVMISMAGNRDKPHTSENEMRRGCECPNSRMPWPPISLLLSSAGPHVPYPCGSEYPNLKHIPETIPAPSNYPLRDPNYHRIETNKGLNRGTLGGLGS